MRIATQYYLLDAVLYSPPFLISLFRTLFFRDYKDPGDSQILMSKKSSVRRQGIFWLLTLTNDPPWTPPDALPKQLKWLRGQQELGAGGFLHWQLLVAFVSKCSRSAVVSLFPGAHAELSRSEAAAAYVWKDDTYVADTRFELGAKPFRRNSDTDWDAVWTSAKCGDLDAIPANVRVVSYRTLRCIAADFDEPTSILRNCHVFWGRSGSGKSRRAWDEAGLGAYSKDPRSKFWCGYRGENAVVIDEFRGGIDISHILRWLDRYPIRVEVKGSSRPLVGAHFWITSNLHPIDWYPDLDLATKQALLRRMEIEEFT